MLKIWGRNNSVNVEKVLWACEEMEIEYERLDAGGQFGIVDTPEYRALNPNGLVPTVEVDGLVLWESNAIVRYLAAKHSRGDLWPNDLAIRVDGDRWMDWMNATFWPGFRDLFCKHFHITTSGNFSNPALLCSVMELGVDRILFSVDWPYVENVEGTEWMEGVPLSEEDRVKILNGNAKRLLKM